MKLTPVQERLLLRKHLTGDFGPVENFKSIRTLLKTGYLEERGKKLLVTKKGRAYCEMNHAQIDLAPYGQSGLAQGR